MTFTPSQLDLITKALKQAIADGVEFDGHTMDDVVSLVGYIEGSQWCYRSGDGGVTRLPSTASDLEAALRSWTDVHSRIDPTTRATLTTANLLIRLVMAVQDIQRRALLIATEEPATPKATMPKTSTPIELWTSGMWIATKVADVNETLGQAGTEYGMLIRACDLNRTWRLVATTDTLTTNKENP